MKIGLTEARIQVSSRVVKTAFLRGGGSSDVQLSYWLKSRRFMSLTKLTAALALSQYLAPAPSPFPLLFAIFAFAKLASAVEAGRRRGGFFAFQGDHAKGL